MTELQLYKYIKENNIEWHRGINNGDADILIVPLLCQVEQFAKLISRFTQEDGMDCVLKNNYLCIWMKEICEHYSIDINEIFSGEEG